MLAKNCTCERVENRQKKPGKNGSHERASSAAWEASPAGVETLPCESHAYLEHQEEVVEVAQSLIRALHVQISLEVRYGTRRQRVCGHAQGLRLLRGIGRVAQGLRWEALHHGRT